MYLYHKPQSRVPDPLGLNLAPLLREIRLGPKGWEIITLRSSNATATKALETSAADGDGVSPVRMRRHT